MVTHRIDEIGWRDDLAERFVALFVVAVDFYRIIVALGLRTHVFEQLRHLLLEYFDLLLLQVNLSLKGTDHVVTDIVPHVLERGRAVLYLLSETQSHLLRSG